MPWDGSANRRVSFCTLGIAQGAAAWSAYAVLEFLASSVLFRLARPYARFTTWHWALTGQLALAYLAAGAACGALAGLAVFALRNKPALRDRPPAIVIEHAAALTLAAAIVWHMATAPVQQDGAWKLLAVPVGLGAMLAVALWSRKWSARFGLLTNPWLLAGLFLGLGLVYMLGDMGVAGQLGVPLRLWRFLLVGMMALAAVAAAWLGQRWRTGNGSRIPAINWAATGLAGALAVAGFAFGTGTSLPATTGPAIAGTSSHPNVVLIVMDTVRADHMSFNGYSRNTTPQLKKLAADATVYAEALSAADITLTSHASIFTGLYPSWHGAYCQPPEASFGRRIGSVPTMAELLTKAGYYSVGVGGNLYLRADFGLQRGFASFRIPRPVPILPTEYWYMLRNGMRRAINLFTDTAQYDRLYSRADAIDDELFAIMADSQAARAPFFAFLNYMDAHFPYIPPYPFDHAFPGKRASVTERELEAIQERVNRRGDALPPAYTEYAVSQYDGGIAYIDSQIGRVVGWLKAQKLYDDTMIVVTGDHGEAFGEKRLFEHGNSLYSNLLHVPLIVKYPHSAHVGRVEAPVSLIDILPTVLAAASAPAPGGIQGRDLAGAHALEPRPLFSESFPCPVLHEPSCPGGCLMRTVVAWSDKYIWSSSGQQETYQLQRDPEERHNLFGVLNPTAQSLSAELRTWGKTMPRLEKEYVNLSPGEIQRFKALGYIQ